MKWLEKFLIDTTVFTYFLTSLGYMLILLDTFVFLYIYTVMIFVFRIAIWFDIIKPFRADNNKK